MKLYNYKKAKELIEKYKDTLEEVSLGMHEDWFWTAEPIWENGEYIKELPDNVSELQEDFVKSRESGMSIFLEEKDPETKISKINPEYETKTKFCIGGLYGSSWATPTLHLKFKDGTSKMIPCYTGESDKTAPIDPGLGCLSGPVQDNIPPLSEE